MLQFFQLISNGILFKFWEIMRLSILTKQEFDDLQSRSVKVYEVKRDVKAVFRVDTGEIVKIFFRKDKLFARWRSSRAKNFYCISNRLLAMGVHALKVTKIMRYPDIGADIAIYDYLPGVSLRELKRDFIRDPGKYSKGGVNLPCMLAKFMASLHSKNIYFRNGHLGNYLLQDNGEFALIDFCNTRFRISPRQRVKNLRKVLFDCADDKWFYDVVGLEPFIDAYLSEANLSMGQKSRIKKLLLSK